MATATVNTMRRPQQCENLLLMAAMALVMLGTWTVLVAVMETLYWFYATEVGGLLLAAAAAAQQLVLFLYHSYNAGKVLGGMLAIWLGVAILEGMVSSLKKH